MSIKARIIALSIAVFLSLATIALIAYSNGVSVKQTTEQSLLRTEQAKLAADMKSAALTLILAGMDSIIDRGEGRVSPQRFERMQFTAAFLENNMESLRQAAETPEELKAYSVVATETPLLVSSILTTLVDLIQSSAETIERIGNDFETIDAVIDIKHAAVTNSLNDILDNLLQRIADNPAPSAAERMVERILLVKDMQHSSTQVVLTAMDIIIDREQDAFSDKHQAIIDRESAFLLNGVQKLSADVQSPADMEMLTALRESLNELLTQITRKLPLLITRAGKDQELIKDAFLTVDNIIDAHGEAVVSSLSVLAQSSHSELLEANKKMLQGVDGSIFLNFTYVLCISAALGVTLLLFGRSILKPVNAALAYAQHVAGGDLNYRKPKLPNDEIGYMSGAVFSMVDSLKRLINSAEEKTQAIARAKEETEQARAELDKRVKERTRELTQANIRLREQDARKTAFLNTVSHELRTPMTSVLGFAKLVLRDFAKHFSAFGESNPKLHGKSQRIIENLTIIESEGMRLKLLIDEVLDLSRIEAKQVVWNDKPVDIPKLVAGCVRSVEGALADKPRVTLKTELNGAHPRIVADENRLHQVLVNILDNAIKFTDSGTISVSTDHTERDELVLRVADTGRGLPPDKLQRIFDKFYQAHNGDTMDNKTVGTGLGLSISREIIEHYGGAITAQSELGRGSVFTIILPAEQ